MYSNQQYFDVETYKATGRKLQQVACHFLLTNQVRSVEDVSNSNNYFTLFRYRYF